MEALRKAHDLILRFERDRIFSSYASARIWVLVPICVTLVLVPLAVLLVVLSMVMQQLPGPDYSLVRLVLFVLAATACLLASSAVLYFVFAWLEKRALSGSRRRG